VEPTLYLAGDATPGEGVGLVMSTTGGPRSLPAVQSALLAADMDFEQLESADAF